MTQPKNLRVLTRLTLRELANDSATANVAKIGRKSIRTFAAPGEPWPRLLVDLLIDHLSEASNRQGDVPLWNRGGQGYRALVHLRRWRDALEKAMEVGPLEEYVMSYDVTLAGIRSVYARSEEEAYKKMAQVSEKTLFEYANHDCPHVDGSSILVEDINPIIRRGPLRRLYVGCTADDAQAVELRNDTIYPWLADQGYDPTGKDNDEFDIPVWDAARVETWIERLSQEHAHCCWLSWRTP